MDKPLPEDYRRAMSLLIFTAPDAFDLAGLNQTLAELAAVERVTWALLALCDIAHLVDPMLRTDHGREALRALVARLTLDAETDTP